MKEYFYLTVCTLGENENLKDCVKALEKIKAISNKKVEILVILNHEPRNTQYTGSAKLLFEPLKGYANVRNKAINSISTFSNIIFLDDDEIPTLQWFDSIVKMHERFPDDLIVGPVLPFERSEVKSYREIRSEKNLGIVDGSEVKHGGAGNMLIPWNLLKNGNILFDTHYNFSGSEDTDFCVRLRKSSVKVRFASSAVLYERESAERFEKKYLDSRFIRDTANYSVVIRRNENLAGIVKRIMILLFRISTTFIFSIFVESYKTKLKAYSLSLICLFNGRVRILDL